MLTRIKREEAIADYPIFPLRHYDRKKDDYVFTWPKTFANYIFALPSKTFKGHQKLLGSEIVKLAKEQGCPHLIFLGDMDVPWLKRLNSWDSFQAALQYLVELKVPKRFDGALQVDIKELPAFIKNLSWLVRTNGVFSYVHFTDPDQNFVGSICKHGDLHVSTKNKRADKKFTEAVSGTSFESQGPNACYERFSKSGIIKGRVGTYY